MFLQKIKINGFKSFGKSIIIDFNSPLTAIVGPNGSGKSNIVDAIKWVLGEQSAKSLRGSKMSDVIFSGSQDYKALNEASVTLFLNNEAQILPVDSNDITITRKVTKDGKSDYFINNNRCRLKDIEELIVDTGLGKDLYSIVGQGEISSIINSKPDNLRELFEENAGIVKHKQRKNKAEKRLVETKNDLQRINDIIWELEKRLPTLKKEAEKTRTYNKLKEKLKKQEVSLLFDRWEQYEIELSEMKSDRNFIYNKIDNESNSLTSLKKKFQKKQNKLDNQESKLDNLREKYLSYNNKYEETKNRLKILDERKNNLERKKEDLKKQKKEIKKDQKRLEEKKINLRNQVQKSENKKKELMKKQDNIKKKLQNKNSQLLDVKNELHKIRNNILNDEELGNIKSNINQKEEKIKYTKKNLNNLVEDSKKLNVNLKNKIEEKEKILEQKNFLEGKKTELEKDIKKLEKKKKDLKEELNDLRKIYESINKKINNKSSRLQVLEEMEEEYNGYYRGVKSILKNRKKFSGILGVIADLINVDKKYEKAIEVALGSRLQNIVVKTDKVARKAVNFLKNNNKGRATFLPLNMIKGKIAYTDKIKQIKGYIGLGSELISYSTDINNIMNYLLGRTVISLNLKSAVKISKATDNKLKIVSLEGDLVNPGGAITGGSSRNNRGLLSRPRQIKELKTEVKSLEVKSEKKSRKGLKIKEKLEKIESRLEEKKEEKRKVDLELNNCNMEVENIDLDIKDIEKKLYKIHNKYFDLINTIQQLEQQLNNLIEQKNTLNKNLDQNKEKIKKEEGKIKKLEKQYDRYKEKITSIKIELASVDQKLTGIKENKTEIKKDIKSRKRKYKEIKDQINKVESDILKIKKDKKGSREQKKDFREKSKNINIECNHLEKLIQKKKEEVKKLDKKIEEKQNELDKNKDNLHKLDLKINRLKNEQNRVKDKLMEDYEINPEENEFEDKTKIDDYSMVENKIKNLKNRIKKLGRVNQGAIKEYKELKERIKYLKDQKQDLNDAKKSINKVIEEIEEEMGKLFIDSYSRVKQEFENIFYKLFSGGEAELTLTDPEDPLNTGVEIVAQPPGKKLRKLSLLSGGERALTAIALVFAFLKVSPSPVYILDEIDAPLDDANIVRFSRFIERYSEIAQFIIITHRKHMMTKVETLYGISMDDSGISKLVSLDLKEEIKN